VKRGLPTPITAVTRDGITTTFYYAVIEDVTDDERTNTTTYYDEWRRPSKILTISKTGDDGILIETFNYFPSGELREKTRRQDGVTVTTKYDYDSLGRLTFTHTDNISTGGLQHVHERDELRRLRRWTRMGTTRTRRGWTRSKSTTARATSRRRSRVRNPTRPIRS
jgi:YD repeat-containing protein